MNVLPPFYEFSKQLIVLTEFMLNFQSSNDPRLVAGIRGTVDRMEELLDAIDAIKLRNGEEVLTFDTSKVRKRLEEIKVLTSTVPQAMELAIGLSNTNPILNETVTIYGTAPLNETITVVITNGSFTAFSPAKPLNGLFSKKYRFERRGVYEVYAIQGNKTSNIVNVTVRKIPTKFIVDDVYSDFINDTIELSGKLVDYYGQPLSGRNVSIGNFTIITGPEGNFSMEYSLERTGTLKVTLTFEGDRIYKATSKTVTLVFRKYPVSISLRGPEEITLGENATFEGTINPPLEVPLGVYINGSLAFNVTPSNGTFSFVITPQEPGTLRVYVEFPSNETYESASSNVLVLTVISLESMFLRYLAITVLTIALAILVVIKKKFEHRTEMWGTTTQTPSFLKRAISEDMQIYTSEDIGKAYKLIRKKLKEKFGISESMTPTEVLKALSRWKLYPALWRITFLHEKAIYSSLALEEEEIKKFRESIKRLIRGDK